MNPCTDPLCDQKQTPALGLRVSKYLKIEHVEGQASKADLCIGDYIMCVNDVFVETRSAFLTEIRRALDMTVPTLAFRIQRKSEGISRWMFGFGAEFQHDAGPCETESHRLVRFNDRLARWLNGSIQFLDDFEVRRNIGDIAEEGVVSVRDDADGSWRLCQVVHMNASQVVVECLHGRARFVVALPSDRLSLCRKEIPKKDEIKASTIAAGGLAAAAAFGLCTVVGVPLAIGLAAAPGLTGAAVTTSGLAAWGGGGGMALGSSILSGISFAASTVMGLFVAKKVHES